MKELFQLAAAAATFAVLDGVWLGMIMTKAYDRGLGSLARRASDGSLAPVWLSAIWVYAMLVGLVLAFIRPLAESVPQAFAYGALLGALTYGVYDFTNHATLKDWPLALSIIDMAWGAFIVGSASAVMAWVRKVAT